MLVSKCMHKNPETISPGETLAEAHHKMTEGAFRRLPVVEEGRLVGIITDRDIREHVGHLEHTKVNAAMTEKPIVVTPGVPLEDAAQIMVRHKIGGLPVMDRDAIVGIVSATDVMRAFVHTMGASIEGTTRIDMVLEGARSDVAGAFEIVESKNATILGMGTYMDEWGGSPVFYLRAKTTDPQTLADALKAGGYAILGVHP